MTVPVAHAMPVMRRNPSSACARRRLSWRVARSVPLIAALVLLASCATKKAPRDETPTLKSLEGHHAVLPPDQGVKANDEATVEAYRQYLKNAPADAQRPEAMRRLGDLEMEDADSRLAGTTAATPAAAAAALPPTALAPSAATVVTAPPATPVAGKAAGARAAVPPAGSANPQAHVAAAASAADAQNYQRAVTLYQDLLKSYPHAPDNDKVLYQLAHAYELGGDLESALKALDRLVQDYPHTSMIDEVQFRRGELMFAMHNYHGAELAYATILAAPVHTPISSARCTCTAGHSTSRTSSRKRSNPSLACWT